jgi:hypothetical protein
MDVPKRYLQILDEERIAAKNACSAFSALECAQDDFIELVAARMASLRWRQRYHLMTMQAQMYYSIFPGLLDPVPMSGWVQPMDTPICNVALAEQCHFYVRDQSSGAFVTLSWNSPERNLIAIEASSWVITSEGALELTMKSRMEQSPETIALSFWENGNARWDLWLWLTNSARVSITWNGNCGSGRWTGCTSDIIAAESFVSRGIVDDLRRSIVDLDSECHINIKLPLTCRAWTEIQCNWDPPHTVFAITPMPQAPLLNCLLIHDLHLQALGFDLREDETPLVLPKVSDVAHSVQSVQVLRQGRLESIPTHGGYSLRDEPQDGLPGRTWLCGLPPHVSDSDTRGIAEIWISGGNNTAGWWKGNSRFEMKGNGVESVFQSVRPVLSHQRGVPNDDWPASVSRFLNMLTTGAAEWSVWRAFLEGLLGHGIPSSHPLLQIVEVHWVDESPVMIVSVKPWEGDLSSTIIQKARMQAFLHVLQRFLKSILPFWHGNMEIQIVNNGMDMLPRDV